MCCSLFGRTARRDSRSGHLTPRMGKRQATRGLAERDRCRCSLDVPTNNQHQGLLPPPRPPPPVDGDAWDCTTSVLAGPPPPGGRAAMGRGPARGPREEAAGRPPRRSAPRRPPRGSADREGETESYHREPAPRPKRNFPGVFVWQSSTGPFTAGGLGRTARGGTRQSLASRFLDRMGPPPAPCAPGKGGCTALEALPPWNGGLPFPATRRNGARSKPRPAA